MSHPLITLMDFRFDISPASALLLIISIVATVISFLIYLRQIMSMHRRRRACRAIGSDELAARVSVPASIIVYSTDRCDDLERLLPQLLSQEYAPGFEVIIVNEGDANDVRHLVEGLQMTHPNLYLTHTPDGARNLSRKKLAITLGIKAARNPVVVLTTDGASINSTRWLARMMQHFAADNHIEVVLGHAAPDAYEDEAWGCRTRSLDFCAETLRWVSDALNGRPWRGTEHNIAYTRDIFFRNKGFSSHLNLRRGDDDIFISKIATPANTAVELSDESVVEVPGALSPAGARELRSRRRFTARYARRPRLLDAIAAWAYLAALVAPCVAVALEPHNAIVLICAGIAIVAWVLSAMIWCNAVTALGGRRLMFTIPLLLATRPLRNLWAMLTAPFRRRKRYTWE